jgi:glucose/arabinose dehydrogenase
MPTDGGLEPARGSFRHRTTLVVLGCVVALTIACSGGDAHAMASGSSLVSIGAGLRGLTGLKASVYARGLPTVAAFTFDPEGRLWVATADYTDHGRDGLWVITAAGAPPVEVVPGLHTPLGLLWYQDSLYVASAGQVDAYASFDGTGFEAHRNVLTLPAEVGEVNQIVASPDGRLLMGISSPCDHCATTVAPSAAIVSFRPDGTDLQTYSSGIRAPVGLAFFPDTSDLFVTMNQRDDLGARTPGDWLALVRAGQSWGFPACYGQGGSACAGVPQPTAVLDKHAAVSGIAMVTRQFGKSAGTAAIVAEWAVGKLQRVALRRAGSSYRATVSAFVTGVKNPVPVVLGPDGALYVGDWATGTVYRIRAS